MSLSAMEVGYRAGEIVVQSLCILFKRNFDLFRMTGHVIATIDEIFLISSFSVCFDVY